jgi:peptidoglycan/LPS O-acetylase OafA/YrhL
LHRATLPVLVALAWLCRTMPAYPFLFAAGEVAFVFSFAYGTPWRGFNRFGDYSYGLYLWGYPAQQAVAALHPKLPFLANAACGFVLALLLAMASWHAVEKPALRLKARRTRRDDMVQRAIPRTDST